MREAFRLIQGTSPRSMRVPCNVRSKGREDATAQSAACCFVTELSCMYVLSSLEVIARRPPGNGSLLSWGVILEQLPELNCVLQRAASIDC